MNKTQFKKIGPTNLNDSKVVCLRGYIGVVFGDIKEECYKMTIITLPVIKHFKFLIYLIMLE